MKSRIGILRRRKERKERRRREGEALWKKLSEQKENQFTSTDWDSCNITWKDWDAWDLGMEEFKKQFIGEWKPDERNSGTSEREENP